MESPDYVQEQDRATALEAKKPIKFTNMSDARSASGNVGIGSQQSIKPSDNDAASYLH